MSKGGQRPRGRNLRKGRHSEPGRIYVITTVVRQRRPLFSNFWTARSLIQVMMGHEQLGLAKNFCFVVMPDHLHWMFQLGEEKNLGDIVQTLKSLTSKRLGRQVFQKGFYDHALRREEDIKNIARYTVANPLRAGIVNDIYDYPHWDAVWM